MFLLLKNACVKSWSNPGNENQKEESLPPEPTVLSLFAVWPQQQSMEGDPVPI